MGFTAFGYERNDGSVQYCLYNASLHLDHYELCIADRDIPIDHNATEWEYCDSLDQYFSNNIMDVEDTRWRILYRLDGTTECRLFSMPGKFIYES